jgi:hypothetical protein
MRIIGAGNISSANCMIAAQRSDQLKGNFRTSRVSSNECIPNQRIGAPQFADNFKTAGDGKLRLKKQ